ncbi:MAG: hypothetical protein KAU21_11215, partial [Gammaproteobacteria bacterium]|nr:hypothetical protein [Gammaproteobacteria bacterium]
MRILKYLNLLLICCFCALPVFAIDSTTTGSDCNTPECQNAQDPQLRLFIKKQLDFYKAVFPEIAFVHLPNHGE